MSPSTNNQLCPEGHSFFVAGTGEATQQPQPPEHYTATRSILRVVGLPGQLGPVTATYSHTAAVVRAAVDELVGEQTIRRLRTSVNLKRGWRRPWGKRGEGTTSCKTKGGENPRGNQTDLPFAHVPVPLSLGPLPLPQS
jgi:hypothetical protein